VDREIETEEKEEKEEKRRNERKSSSSRVKRNKLNTTILQSRNMRNSAVHWREIVDLHGCREL
jgi:hypothetical protein